MRFYFISLFIELIDYILKVYFNWEILYLGFKEIDSIVKSISYKFLFYEMNILCVIIN